MTSVQCIYELKDHHGAVVSTGRLNLDEPPRVGNELVLGTTRTRIEAVTATPSQEMRLTLREN